MVNGKNIMQQHSWRKSTRVKKNMGSDVTKRRGVNGKRNIKGRRERKIRKNISRNIKEGKMEKMEKATKNPRETRKWNKKRGIRRILTRTIIWERGGRGYW